MFAKKMKLAVMVAAAMSLSVVMFGCGEKKSTEAEKPATEAATDAKDTETASADEGKADEAKAAEVAAPGEAGGFTEVPIGDEHEVGPLVVAGVYFQPVDMEPAGNSLSKEEADCHIEADISASAEGATLGYGQGDFVPWLQVKAYIQKQGSDKVQEIAFMPMNASDGPHYGANMKFEEGLGKYSVKFEISAPGNDYLLHVDKETGVTGRFWTEPIVVEWPDFEWAGPQW